VAGFFNRLSLRKDWKHRERNQITCQGSKLTESALSKLKGFFRVDFLWGRSLKLPPEWVEIISWNAFWRELHSGLI
jgi:hypothetical protein